MALNSEPPASLFVANLAVCLGTEGILAVVTSTTGLLAVMICSGCRWSIRHGIPFQDPELACMTRDAVGLLRIHVGTVAKDHCTWTAFCQREANFGWHPEVLVRGTRKRAGNLRGWGARGFHPPPQPVTSQQKGATQKQTSQNEHQSGTAEGRLLEDGWSQPSLIRCSRFFRRKDWKILCRRCE